MSASHRDDSLWIEQLALGTPSHATTDGLSAAEAAARLARSGPKLLRQQRAHSLLFQFLSRFRIPLVLILLVGSSSTQKPPRSRLPGTIGGIQQFTAPCRDIVITSISS